MFRNSFHLGVQGDVWGMLQGYVGVPLEMVISDGDFRPIYIVVQGSTNHPQKTRIQTATLRSHLYYMFAEINYFFSVSQKFFYHTISDPDPPFKTKLPNPKWHQSG